jgi:hypothetical protein
VAELSEAHAEELLRGAELQRPQVPQVPAPGLWS